MGQAILVLVWIGVTIYAAISCIRCDEADVRAVPKALWLVVIVFLPLAGGLLWILLGDTSTPGHSFGRGSPKVVAPDDDPDFLRSLNKPGRHDED